MPKKYRLLIDSPELPKGTEVLEEYIHTPTKDGRYYRSTTLGRVFPCTVVEDRPEV